MEASILDIALYMCIFALGVIIGRVLMALQYSAMTIKAKTGSLKPKLGV
jgi:hypothetical protein